MSFFMPNVDDRNGCDSNFLSEKEEKDGVGMQLL